MNGHVLALALGGALWMPLAAQVPAPVRPLGKTDFARIDSIFAPYASLDRPGYAIGIVQRGRLVHARGFGAAIVASRTPITPRTAFNVASLSKQFTAAAVALLIRRGRLSLADEVRRHIPEFPAYRPPVRVEHLVYMTSGLHEYYSIPRSRGKDWTDSFDVAEAIRASLAQPAPLFRPGERWAYSNVNYMLLAEIVARVSGVPFAQFIRREIFAPLGMRSSLVHDDLSRSIPDRAAGYNRVTGGGWREEVRRSPHYGGSGVFTTIEDLARWDRSFETHSLGGPALTELLLATRRFDHPKANDAFGLVWGQFRGRRTLWYEGGDLGYSSYMVRLPDDRLTVIVLSNDGAGAAAAHARRVLDIVVPEAVGR